MPGGLAGGAASGEEEKGRDAAVAARANAPRLPSVAAARPAGDRQESARKAVETRRANQVGPGKPGKPAEGMRGETWNVGGGGGRTSA